MTVVLPTWIVAPGLTPVLLRRAPLDWAAQLEDELGTHTNVLAGLLIALIR